VPDRDEGERQSTDESTGEHRAAEHAEQEERREDREPDDEREEGGSRSIVHDRRIAWPRRNRFLSSGGEICRPSGVVCAHTTIYPLRPRCPDYE